MPRPLPSDPPSTSIPTIDFSTLKLRASVRYRFERDEEEEEMEEEDGEDEDEDEEEGRWNRVLSLCDYRITDAEDKVLGVVEIWYFETWEFSVESDWLSFMDQWNQESHKFSCLFDGDAQLRSRFLREGKGVFGPEVTEASNIAYIHEMRIEPEYRGLGLGTWALDKLLAMLDERWHYTAAKAMFVEPGALNSEFSYRDRGDAASHLDMMLAISARVTKFFQRSGFRRIGTTSFLCYARDPQHPSRTIPMHQDAEYEEDVTMSHGDMVRMLARGTMPW
ncbi:hypothetical protein NBRC10512_004945 [Rhodotorula toruloides]|uniref:RHTO0S01e13344g1_1 n=2 Tax=Rhodotorula toruloides TaxID=5286 RepID=A0A061AMW5_RHOTO|nr:N-acetyltransferase [Rhodotorula toruloides NP11]EMS24487.1 N-acetyltransferase [Rhodotorula toruloides NP11]CDR36061.1 RHTO0S01e13344g1_1 [Rhodotorula toruloides]